MIRKLYFYISNLIIIIAPFVLLFLPSNYFDEGQSVCLSVQLAGIECYACGLTRATMHFMHFEFQEAWNYNKLVFIVVPMLSVLWLKAVYDIQGKKLPGRIGKLTNGKEA